MATGSFDPQVFERISAALRAYSPRSEIILEEVPAPQKLAAHAFALSADVSNGLLGDDEDELASGRFVLLHEPGGQDTWEGEFRAVTFVRADVDPVMQEDPLLPEFGWNWFLEALNSADCNYTAASGTVTRVASTAFGKLSQRSDEAEMEIRASWTPVFSGEKSIEIELTNHLKGWCDLLAQLAVLEALPEGVAAITAARRR